MALFLVAFAESSVFPIPPDVLLIALAIGAPRRALWFAALSTVGSVLGGMLGYLIGLKFYELLGRPIIEFYSAQERYLRVKELYDRYDSVAVAVAGFTPIPYKVFTIAAGAFEIHFPTFVVASLAGRGGRFFLVGLLILRFGREIRYFLDRYFNWLTVVFVVLLVGGFFFLREVM